MLSTNRADMKIMHSLSKRLGLSIPRLATYLGVPHNTARNWYNGLRGIPAPVHKLIAVLGLVETLAPEIHDQLLPQVKERGVVVRTESDAVCGGEDP